MIFEHSLAMITDEKWWLTHYRKAATNFFRLITFLWFQSHWAVLWKQTWA